MFKDGNNLLKINAIQAPFIILYIINSSSLSILFSIAYSLFYKAKYIRLILAVY